MVSLITTNAHIRKIQDPLLSFSYPLIPSLVFVYNPPRKPRNYRKGAILSRSLGSLEVNRARKFGKSFESSKLGNYWCCCCKESEGDVELEAEILDFMEKSERPTMFPTREELLKSGRRDLVEAIKRTGGWYSLGWGDDKVGDEAEERVDFDVGEFQRRVENCKESASLREYVDNNSMSGHEFSSAVHANAGNFGSLESASSSSPDRALELGADEDTGIEGILNRLEKQRNSEFGISLKKDGYGPYATSKRDGHDRDFDTSLDSDRSDLGDSSRLKPVFHSNGLLNTSGGKISPTIEPEDWRTWSNQRAGFQHTEFEAAEIPFSKHSVESEKEIYHDRITAITEECADSWDRHKEINHNQIRTHLQHLEFELNTALRSLRSKRDMFIPEEVTGSSSDLGKLSDAWEFQENEFMSAQDRLRSIRAKLAVLEGKMALAIIDAQKAVVEKQKRIDGARKALQLLRTTCIVWPNSATEVLLVGSFDGWTTQRRMEKSRTGIFSVCLKLYPGRYEIKFIVDGIWKIDPLRPIVNKKGYENNLLIVT